MFEVTVLNAKCRAHKWDGTCPVRCKGPALAIDTETLLISNEEPYKIPEVVLLQVTDGFHIELIYWDHIKAYLKELMYKNKNSLIFMHNAPFDLNVLDYNPLWSALDNNRIVDTGIRFQLRELKRKGALIDKYPSLAEVGKKILNIDVEKEENIRLNFTRITPVTHEQEVYAAKDPLITWLSAMYMGSHKTETTHTKGFVALDYISRLGIKVGKDSIEEQRKKFLLRMDQTEKDLKSYGIYMEREKTYTTSQMLEDLKEKTDIVIGTFENDKYDIKLENALILLYKLLSDNETFNLDTLRKQVQNEINPENKENALVFLENTLETEFPVLKSGKKTINKKPVVCLLYETVKNLVDRYSLKETIERVTDKYYDNYGWDSNKKPMGSDLMIQKLLEDIVKTREINLPKTPTGKYSTNTDALASLTEEDLKTIPFLKNLKDYKHSQKILETYLDTTAIGVDGRIHCYFNPIVNTGRSSCRRPNLQNIPKEPGIRECYEAAEGYVLVSVDYDQQELCALAEHCYIRYAISRMMDLINLEIDLHSWFGAYVKNMLTEEEKELDPSNLVVVNGLKEKIKRWKKEEEFKGKTRPFAKVSNFGFPGGLGPATFVPYARQYGIEVTEDEARSIKDNWKKAFPEMIYHLEPTECANLEDDGYYTATTLTGRIRNRCTYNAACNTVFQGLAADASKTAAWELVKRKYRVVNFIHDEFLIELPEDKWLTPRIKHIKDIMEKSMRSLTPHVRIATGVSVMRRWDKNAPENDIDENGNYKIFENR